jgi:hypothetical protein
VPTWSSLIGAPSALSPECEVNTRCSGLSPKARCAGRGSTARAGTRGAVPRSWCPEPGR